MTKLIHKFLIFYEPLLESIFHLGWHLGETVLSLRSLDTRTHDPYA